jgi:hypothetical protein
MEENYSSIREVKNPPSKLLPYPEGSKIFVSGLNFGDIMKISDSNLSEIDAYKIRMKYITTEKIDKLDLTYQDFLYSCFMMDYLSLDNDTFAIDYNCKNTSCKGHKDTQEALFKYEDIVFEDLGDNAYGKKITKLPLEYKSKKGNVFKFLPLTIKWFMFLHERNLIKDIIARYSVMLKIPFVLDLDKIKKIEGNDYDRNLTSYFNDAKKIISEDLGLYDLNALKAIDQIFAHGIEPLKKSCELCKEVNEITVDTPYTVIRSFREVNGILEDEIRFS